MEEWLTKGAGTRRGSIGKLENKKRKREKIKKEKEKAEIESAFRRSKKVLRSPEQGVKVVGKEGTEKSTGGRWGKGGKKGK